MRARVALDDEPAVAARRMEPQLAVQPGGVVAQIHVVVERSIGRVGLWTLRHGIAVMDEFVVAAGSAMGAVDTHQCRLGCGPWPFSSMTRPAAKRQTTSVAPQALQLFNGDFINRQARHFAERLRREAEGEAAQIELAYRLALARRPTAAERDAMSSFLRTGSLEEMSRVILNLNEFAYAN